MKLTRDQIREKYMKLVHTAGVDQAVTELNREIGNRLEPGIYDGGFDKDRLAEVEFMRELSREIYSYKTVEASKKKYGEQK